MSNELLTISAAARAIGRDRSTITRWIEQGALPAVTLPSGRPAIRYADLEALTGTMIARPVTEPPSEVERAMLQGILHVLSDPEISDAVAREAAKTMARNALKRAEETPDE